MDTYVELEDIATHIDSDIRVIHSLLLDLQMEYDSYRVYAILVLADHLQGLGTALDNALADAKATLLHNP